MTVQRNDQGGEGGNAAASAGVARSMVLAVLGGALLGCLVALVVNTDYALAFALGGAMVGGAANVARFLLASGDDQNGRGA